MRILMAAAVVVVIGLGSPYFAGANESGKTATYNLDIPAQNLNDALQALALASKHRLIYSSVVVDGKSAPAVKGEFTAAEAAARLLEGTKLTYELTSDGLLVIRRVQDMKSSMETVQNADLHLARSQLQQMQEAGESSAPPPSTTRNSASASESSADDSDASSSKIQEIVVTAQKREENLQDVPTSMTVLSAAKLESQGLAQLSDYAKQIPGFRMIGGGAPGIGRPVLRGISTGTDRSALVGIYLDDVSFTPSSSRTNMAAFAFDPSLSDVERIEVLKGPQSTLYGASAMGGLIKFVSKRPDLSAFDGSVRVDGTQVDSGGSGYGARASVNIPIAEQKVGARVSVFYRDDPGYITNTATGEDDVNSSTVQGARFSLLAKLTDRVETTFTGLAQDIDVADPHDVFLDRTTLQPSLGGLAQSSLFNQSNDIQYRALSNSTVLDLGFASLTNIAGYARFSTDQTWDNGLVAAFFSAPAGIAYTTTQSRRYSDEIRLTSVPGRFEWMLGGFYTDEKDEWNVDARGADASGVILPPSSPGYDTYTWRHVTSYKESAVFGNITYHLTDRLGATLGARYNTNDQTFAARGVGRLYVNTLNPTGHTSGHATSDSANNYLATVTYEAKDNLTSYLRVASAYRPGGPNALTSGQLALGLPSSFDADTLWNYETGIKGSALDRRLRYSAAAYFVDWKDTQINVLTTITGQGTFTTTGNVAKASGKGVEVSLDFQMLNDLSVGVSGAYNDTEIGADAPALGAFKGDPLPYSSKISLSALMEYRTTLSNGFTPNAGLSYAYYSEQNTAFTNPPTTSIRLPAYGILDIRAGLDWSDYSVIARIDNVADKYAVTAATRSALYFGSPTVGQVLRPRTFGLSFEARF